MWGLVARFGTWVVQLLAPIFIDKIGGAIRKWLARRAARKAAEAEARKSVEDLKKAKDAKEVDDAADDALDGV
jgi:hypothetical protein